MSEHKKNTGDDAIESAYKELTVFENFFSSHFKNIAILCVVIILLIGVGIQLKNRFASDDLSVAAQINSAKTIEEIEALLKKYPNYKSSDYARLKLGTLYFGTKDYKKAIEIFSALAQKSRYDDLKAQSALNEACAIEQSGKPEEAAEKYSAIGLSPKYPAEYRAGANCSAARIFITLGKLSQAKSCLDLINPASLTEEKENPHYQQAQLMKYLCEK
jgi:tetratricopeptide (TPR) repeat protein